MVILEINGSWRDWSKTLEISENSLGIHYSFSQTLKNSIEDSIHITLIVNQQCVHNALSGSCSCLDLALHRATKRKNWPGIEKKSEQSKHTIVLWFRRERAPPRESSFHPLL